MHTALIVLGAATSVAFAQSYTGPKFDPSNAPFFGPGSVVVPTLTVGVPTAVETPTFIRSRESSAASVSESVTSIASASVSGSLSGPQSTSASASASASESAASQFSLETSASRSSFAASSAAAPARSSSGAAVVVVNGPAWMGAVAGGVAAGLALL